MLHLWLRKGQHSWLAMSSMRVDNKQDLVPHVFHNMHVKISQQTDPRPQQSYTMRIILSQTYLTAQSVHLSFWGRVVAP